MNEDEYEKWRDIREWNHCLDDKYKQITLNDEEVEVAKRLIFDEWNGDTPVKYLDYRVMGVTMNFDVGISCTLDVITEEDFQVWDRLRRKVFKVFKVES